MKMADGTKLGYYCDQGEHEVCKEPDCYCCQEGHEPVPRCPHCGCAANVCCAHPWHAENDPVVRERDRLVDPLLGALQETLTGCADDALSPEMVAAVRSVLEPFDLAIAELVDAVRDEPRYEALARAMLERALKNLGGHDG